MNCNIGLRHIKQLKSLILDTKWFVELLIGVHGAASLALRSVQHVGAANLLQVEGVLRSTSGNKSNP